MFQMNWRFVESQDCLDQSQNHESSHQSEHLEIAYIHTHMHCTFLEPLACTDVMTHVATLKSVVVAL